MKARDTWTAELNRPPPDNMQHGEWLIQRIIVPEGAPVVVRSSSIQTDWILSEMVTIGRSPERDGMSAKDAAIRPAPEPDDQVTAELLQRILWMEKGHLGEVQHSDPIEQTGRQNVPPNQITHEAA